MKWYVLRVASNKEGLVRDKLERKVAVEGLSERIGRILAPTERVPRPRTKPTERKFTQRKLYPGYCFIEMEPEENGAIPEDVWFLIKETSGVGDFIGSEGKPTPITDRDIEKILTEAEKPEEATTLRVDFSKGDQVKIKEGPFENFEGLVEAIEPEKGMVRVIVTIFGRATPLDIEYWMIEAA